MAVAPHLRRKLCHRTAEETSVIVRLPKSLAVVVVAGAVLALSLSSGAPPVHATALSTGVGRGAWAQVAELAGPPTAFGDGFGGSVAVSGGTAIVGAPGTATGSDRAYVFHQSTRGWHQVAKLAGSSTAVDDSFGNSLAISGGTAIVGDPDRANSAGRAYVFQESPGLAPGGRAGGLPYRRW